jgi:hypothetical protein
MLPRIVVVTLALAAAVGPVAGQAVSEFRTVQSLPVAVVEVAGGDVEHFAAFLPPEAAVPDLGPGLTNSVVPRRGGVVLHVVAPELQAVRVRADLVAKLATTGCAALVALGPVPARELLPPAGEINTVPHRPIARVSCLLAEGGAEVERGSPERAELRLALPDAGDLRFELAAPFAVWLEERLAKAVPGSRVAVELESGCTRLVIRAPAEFEHPRGVVVRLRAELARIGTSGATTDDAERLAAAVRRDAATVARDGSAIVIGLAERLALGGRASGVLVAPFLDAATLTTLAQGLLVGHPGFATLIEQERRAPFPETHPLDNGVTVRWRWIPGEFGVAALALSGVTPDVAQRVTGAVAEAAAGRGWTAEAAGIAGIATVAIAAPPEELTEVLETVAEILTRDAGPTDGATGVAGAAALALGLSPGVGANAVAAALSLPPEAEEATEAAVKFLASLPGRGVEDLPAPVQGLVWTPGAQPAEIAAALDLPASAAGWVAGEVLAGRLTREAGCSTAWLSPPGRFVLLVRAAGDADLPALDNRLAAALRAARGAVAAGELRTALQRVRESLYGDPTRATARLAAETFLPVVPRPEELQAIEAAAVNQVLSALPEWSTVTRHAQGAQPEPPPKRGVRKSPPRQP